MASLAYHENENSTVMDHSSLGKKANGPFSTKFPGNKSLIKPGIMPRTFGNDISNRFKKGTNHSDLKDTKIFQSGEIKVKKRTTPDYDSFFSGKDFRPEITEIEDYDDILPPPLRLRENDMNKFVHAFCGRNRSYYRPSEDDLLCSPPRASSSNLELLKPIPIKDELNFALQPIEEDCNVFDLPRIWD